MSFCTPRVGVTVISPNDVWAVGYLLVGSVQHPLIEHWDGASSTATMQGGANGALNGVAAAASDDVWAVGYTKTGSLIEHWDGSRWTVSSAQVMHGLLQAVTSVSAGLGGGVAARERRRRAGRADPAMERFDLVLGQRRQPRLRQLPGRRGRGRPGPAGGRLSHRGQQRRLVPHARRGLLRRLTNSGRRPSPT